MNNANFIILGLVSLLTISYVYLRSSRRLPIPPGPKKLPLIGNLLDFPKGNEWLTYKRWSDEYKSDIIHLNIVGMDIILLNSAGAVNDLLEKRSAIYSSRKHLPMLMELMGWEWSFAMMPNDERWRRQRKLFLREFGAESMSRYHPHKLTARNELLRRLLDSPDMWMDHLRHISGQTVMSISYGIQVLPSRDPYLETAEKAMASLLLAARPGAFLVDSIPALKYVPDWFPGAGFKRKAKEWFKLSRKLVEIPYDTTKRKFALGSASPSFVASCLEKLEGKARVAEEEEDIMSIAANVYFGGSDTTVSVLETFILAMVLRPDAQVRAQQEIDAVVATGHFPSFGDEKSLPYVSAIAKEVLRWQPAFPIAIPHYSIVEDTYKGYRIPAGSTVIPNTWAILHDEATYPDPSSFRPERFLKDGKLNPDVKDPIAAFGYGRRICPGQFLAQSEIWIMISSILACFSIHKAIDENGRAVEPSMEYTTIMIRHPSPFNCTIRPRSAEVENAIRSTLDQDYDT